MMLQIALNVDVVITFLLSCWCFTCFQAVHASALIAAASIKAVELNVVWTCAGCLLFVQISEWVKDLNCKF